MPPQFKDPLKQHLSTLLGGEVESDIIEYIQSIKNKEDLDEFLQNLVDQSNPAHLVAYKGIHQCLLGNKRRHTEKKPDFHIQAVQQKEKIQLKEKNVANKPSDSKTHKGKGKKKFQDIKKFKEKEKVKEGRSECSCEGQVHEFMNNCLNCGRIHCSDEGPGPCLFCGEPIGEMGDNRQAQTFKHKANKIYDDDNDYFKVKTNREAAKKKGMIVALDFATRRVIESTEEDHKIKKKLLEDSKKHLKNVEQLYRNLSISNEKRKVENTYEDMVNLLVKMRHVKQPGVENLGPEDGKMPAINYGNKIFSEEYDHGLCLSMHQPYASLLIAGVKKHEGRTWPTNHRGRLWIAAAAKAPDEDEISALENLYRDYYNEPSLKFPTSYPTSCLLGCVYVEDCMDQETYKKEFPSGESNSPYVLICSNPIILPIFYPIVGKHKIYPLDKDLHNCAKLCLRYAKFVD